MYESANPPIQEQMCCMEVRGSHGDVSHYFRRPGLDVWVNRQSAGNTAAGGGDMHVISSCASGRITRILLADVCSFGSLFGQFARQLSAIMKKNVNTVQQARSVRQLSEQLAAASQEGVLASAFLSTYFSPTRSFTFCNAGHPPLIKYHHQSREWTVLEAKAPRLQDSTSGLGVVDPGEYHQRSISLEISDMILAFSNSLTESRCRNGRTIGLDGLLQRVKLLTPQAPGAIPGSLLRGLREEHADNLTDVDATVLLCQGTNTTVRWKDNWLAPFRLLGPVSDCTSFA